jgi:hypothetical protein
MFILTYILTYTLTYMQLNTQGCTLEYARQHACKYTTSILIMCTHALCIVVAHELIHICTLMCCSTSHARHGTQCACPQPCPHPQIPMQVQGNHSDVLDHSYNTYIHINTCTWPCLSWRGGALFWCSGRRVKPARETPNEHCLP